MSSLRAASTDDGAGAASPAATAILSLLGPAAGAAALRERVGELAELDLGLVRFGQLAGELGNLRRLAPQEIEVERLSVEQVLHIDEDGWDSPFPQPAGAGGKGLGAVPLQTRQEQIILHRHPAEERAVQLVARCGVQRREDLSHFQSAAGAGEEARPPTENRRPLPPKT